MSQPYAHQTFDGPMTAGVQQHRPNQMHMGQSSWGAGHPPTGPAVNHPPPSVEPTFQVRTVKHTGGLIFWFNESRTITGTYARCDAMITAAQRHCLLAGWWSIGSLLWNPISLSQNAGARKSLLHQAQRAHEYSLWWSTHYGGVPQRAPVWTPPPAR